MTAWRIWAWPAGLGALMASGLVSALVADGWGDCWSWLALGVPVAVMAVFGLGRAPASSAGALPASLPSSTERSR